MTSAEVSELPHTGVVGALAGIALKARPRGPMEVLDRVVVSINRGIEGDYRGVLRPGKRNRRQVTLFEREDWEAALAQVGADADWPARRCNLMIERFDLPQRPGARLRLGDVLLEVTTECDPCVRMDAVAPGLFQALVPDWRGGACARVLEGGTVAVGDTIRCEDA